MNINPTTLANQPIPTTTESPAFKGNRNLMHREMAVRVMQDVRCSYNNFEPNVISNVLKKIQGQLKTIVEFQNKEGAQIFDSSDILAVKSKINSLKTLIESKSKKA